MNKTYQQHYSQNKYQATEFIIDGGHGEGFCIGNIMKYAQRYGKKKGKFTILMGMGTHDTNDDLRFLG